MHRNLDPADPGSRDPGFWIMQIPGSRIFFYPGDPGSRVLDPGEPGVRVLDPADPGSYILTSDFGLQTSDFRHQTSGVSRTDQGDRVEQN